MPGFEHLGTVNVDCPRPGCSDKVQCTLRADSAEPKPGAKSVTISVTVPDLADQMAAHYQDRHPVEFADVFAAR